MQILLSPVNGQYLLCLYSFLTISACSGADLRPQITEGSTGSSQEQIHWRKKESALCYNVFMGLVFWA